MKKNQRDRILKREPKEQHISIVPKSCPYIYIYILWVVLGPQNALRVYRLYSMYLLTKLYNLYSILTLPLLKNALRVSVNQTLNIYVKSSSKTTNYAITFCHNSNVADCEWLIITYT